MTTVSDIVPDSSLGPVRFLSPAERELPVPGLSPLLVPLADAGPLLYALYEAPELGARSGAVCAVDRASGVYLPVASGFRGFVAHLLLSLCEPARGPAGARLASACGLDPLLAEPDGLAGPALARRLVEVDRGSPWACSVLAQECADPREGLRRLGPALAAVPWAAGLFFQAFELACAAGEPKRAARCLWAALGRLEPNRQAVPARLGTEPLVPLQLEPAIAWLRAHGSELSLEQRLEVQYAFLNPLGDPKALQAALGRAVDESRRRGLGGDLPGARWILHLALGACGDDAARRAALCAELAQTWGLAGADRLAARMKATAGRGG